MLAPLHEIKGTVLVVDDSPDIRRFLRVLLEMESYLVETASNGEEALERLQNGFNPHVVLLDIQMPGMNGLQTLRYIRRRHPEMKVIMCSGEEDPRKMRRAASLGAQAYITKPVQQLYLSAALERCRAGKSAFPGNLMTFPPQGATS